MRRRFFRRSSSKPSKAKPTDGFSATEYAVNGFARGEGGNAAGVFIDGFLTQLQGEPPVRTSTVHGWIAH